MSEVSTRRMRAGELVHGHLEVVRPLGEGGMGEVFVARDKQLGRRVAIKTLKLPAGITQDERERFDRRFERDAMSAAQLSHPNIVTIHQFGEHRGLPFLVLELVEGTTLDVLAAEGRPSERETLELGVQLCDALSYAHESGIAHRGLRPSSLMRTRDGRLKILDFGIAVSAYLAPEQTMEALEEAHEDVRAVGHTIYVLLTGQRPHDAELAWPEHSSSSGETMAIVEECLKDTASERTASFRALGAALTKALEQLSRPDALQTAEEKRTNLVAPQDAFLGRSDDLQRMDEAVLDEAHGLVTLVGPAGAGKTRLVTEWGLRVLERGEVQEVMFCSLTEARNRDGILAAIGSSLDVPLTQEDAAEQLGWVLARRPGLVLILDNGEQVARELAGLLDAWSNSAPGVTMVVTSRVELDLAGEQVVEVDSLRDTQQAVALYTERARRVRPGWRCPKDMKEALVELMEELDRLPLAIELAAARVEDLPPNEMLERIAQRFEVLGTRDDAAHEKQATLRGAIAWSWELLDEPHEAAMAQLSVFEGSFTLEAAEEVIDLSGFEDEPFVLDVIEELVGASMLRSEVDTEHFKMLVSIRAYAAEQLAATGDEPAARARHARWFSRWTFDEVEQEGGQGFPEPLDEVDDLAAASLWGLSPGRSADEREWALACTAVLAAIMALKGPFRHAEELDARVEASDGADTAGLARALGRIGVLFRLGGQSERARLLLARCATIARQVGDAKTEGHSLGGLASIASTRGHAKEARDLYERALAIARQSGDQHHEGAWLGALGKLEASQGRVKEARELYDQGIAMARRLGDSRNEGISMGNLGNLEYEQGNLDEARALFERALAIARKLGEHRQESAWLGSLGLVHADLGLHDEAESFYERALAIARRAGNLRQEGIWLGNLGTLEFDRGRLERTLELYERSLVIARQLGERRQEGMWLSNLGYIHHELGHADEARVCHTQSLQVIEQLGDTPLQIRQHTLLGSCALAEEDHEGARAHLEACFALLSSSDPEQVRGDTEEVRKLADALGVEVPPEIIGG